MRKIRPRKSKESFLERIPSVQKRTESFPVHSVRHRLPAEKNMTRIIPHRPRRQIQVLKNKKKTRTAEFCPRCASFYEIWYIQMRLYENHNTPPPQDVMYDSPAEYHQNCRNIRGKEHMCRKNLLRRNHFHKVYLPIGNLSIKQKADTMASAL